MFSNILNIFEYNNTQEQEKEYLYLNDTRIEINIDRNFSYEEFQAIKSSNSSIYKWFRTAPLDYFKGELATSEERSYARYLAFYRRINLDLKELISLTLKIDNYEFKECPNFEKFDAIFEKYYPLFDKHNAHNTKLKTNFKNLSLRIILKLWMCGYGILPGYTEKHITTEFLEELKKHPSKTVNKFIRFISFALSQESDSPVKEVVKLIETTSLFDREKGKWDKVLDGTSSSEIGLVFRDFSLGQLYDRTKAPLLQEYFVDGKRKRETYKKITTSTFTNYSSAYRKFYNFAKDKNISTIDELLDGGTLRIISDARGVLDDSSFTDLKIVIRFWLLWYKNQNNLDFNIDRMCPREVSNNTRSFGKVLNMSQVVTLVSALLDDSLPFYENISLSDYRCRYICLLLLSTGQRVSELCMLKYDCLKNDKDSNLYLIMHKTKTNTGNIVKATPDVINYVEKLRAVAPPLKLLFSSEEYPGADDLEVERLVANKFNDGPLTEKTVNDFLRRLQCYLFPNNKKKVFSSHDFRRIKATYMRLAGYSNEDIQKQLGQSDTNSQIPYLQTKPLSHQKHFEEILEEGVYEIDEDDNIIVNQDKIIEKTKGLVNNDEKHYENLINSILSNIKDVDDISIPSVDVSLLEPTGFPVGLFSCSASAIVICNNSPIECFNYDHYVPEIDSLENHKVELFRYMILSKYQANALKSTKDMIFKSIVTEKNKHIDNAIQGCFSKLFSKFNLNNKDIDKIKLDLESKLKKYSRKYLKSNPSPTFKQAKTFLEKGEL